MAKQVIDSAGSDRGVSNASSARQQLRERLDNADLTRALPGEDGDRPEQEQRPSRRSDRRDDRGSDRGRQTRRQADDEFVADEADDDEDLDADPDADPDDESQDDEDDAGTDADAEDDSEPRAGRGSGRAYVHRLEDQLADLSDQIAELRRARSGDDDEGTEATTTEREGGAAASPARSASAKKAAGRALDKYRAKVEAANEKWGDLIEELGLMDLLDELDTKFEGIDKAEKTRASQAKQAQEQEAAKVGQMIVRTMDSAAGASSELRKLIGVGRAASPRQIKLRREIYEEAVFIEEQSARRARSGRGKAVTGADAILAGIKEVTGISIKRRDPEGQARDRARQRTPSRGGASGVRGGGNDVAERRQAAADRIDGWARSRG